MRTTNVFATLTDLKTRIEATAGLEDIPVHIARQQDLETDIAIALDKSDSVILLYPPRMKREDVLPGAPYLTQGLIEMITLPLLQSTTGDTARPADEVVELLHWTLDGWKPASPAIGLWVDKLAIEEVAPGTDGQYLVYQINWRTRIHLKDSDSHPTNPSEEEEP
jgi:hypothetical protein